MREARVRQAYAAWYPGIDARAWHDAAWLTETILRRRRSESLEAGRALPEAQFEFRGPEPLQERPYFRRPKLAPACGSRDHRVRNGPDDRGPPRRVKDPISGPMGVNSTSGFRPTVNRQSIADRPPAGKGATQGLKIAAALVGLVSLTLLMSFLLAR